MANSCQAYFNFSIWNFKLWNISRWLPEILILYSVWGLLELDKNHVLSARWLIVIELSSQLRFFNAELQDGCRIFWFCTRFKDILGPIKVLYSSVADSRCLYFYTYFQVNPKLSPDLIKIKMVAGDIGFVLSFEVNSNSIKVMYSPKANFIDFVLRSENIYKLYSSYSDISWIW